jgi:SAM-dependent methyltransferase
MVTDTCGPETTPAERRVQLPVTFHEVVDEIVRFTDLPRAEVEQRVWMQALEPGWNVLRDVRRFDVTPFQFDGNMGRLYAEGDGFIFDSLVFWARPARRLWIQHAVDRIRLHARHLGVPAADLAILMFGDGPGNDSLFLADRGLTVDYHEVAGSRTYEFAVRRFRHYGFLGRHIRPIDDYRACLHGQYDVVLSFEVLEHLPEPLVAVQEIGAALKQGGIAIITEDFGDLAGYLPTHLKSSARYLGAAPFLFLHNHMVLTWYSRDELFKPYEFVKVATVGAGDWIRLARNHDVRSLYLSRFAGSLARFVTKLPYVRVRRHD